MKVFTEEHFEKIILKIKNESFQKGYDEGHRVGLNKGLMTSKEGVVLNNNGIFFFKDGEVTDVKTEQTLNDDNSFYAGKSYDFWNSEEDSIYDK